MSRLLIANGTLYDPTNGIDGEVRDLWVEGGKIIPPPSDPAETAERVLDARGYVIMPGGIDMHCHIAGPKVNIGRKMLPEMNRAGGAHPRVGKLRSGIVGAVPSTFTTGYLYASMGYTTAFDAAIPGLLARHAHEEFQDTPMLDKGFYLLFGNNHFVMDQIRRGDTEALDAYCAWGLNAVKGYTIKLVNPGGVENWKQISRKTTQELDAPVAQFGVSPRQIVTALAGCADRLRLPHSVHIHCNNLGIPGNWETTLHTMRALEGQRGHFAHIQYHSYGGDPNEPRSFRAATDKLLDYVHSHANITLDVGHVNPGWTVSMTGDAPFSYYLHQLSGRKWFTHDCEQESSCGVIPIEYRPEKSLIHATQWAIALEWYLRMEDPWRIAMTSDHPNGGAFYRYPEIIQLLMDPAYRRDMCKQMPEQLRERSCVAELDRAYSLQEIAIITRAAPARILGLTHKGHLGPGADADITIYTDTSDRQAMFARPRWVFKAGELISEDGSIRREVYGRTYFVEPGFDRGHLGAIQEWFEEHYTLAFANYAVEARYIPEGMAVH